MDGPAGRTLGLGKQDCEDAVQPRGACDVSAVADTRPGVNVQGERVQVTKVREAGPMAAGGVKGRGFHIAWWGACPAQQLSFPREALLCFWQLL